MYKITNIDSLGTDYTVADQNGDIIKIIQIIPHTEILDAALGEFSESFESMSAYLEESISVLSGFDIIDPHKVLWYSSTDEDVILSDIIEYAVEHDYDTVILEYLEDLEK